MQECVDEQNEAFARSLLDKHTKDRNASNRDEEN